MLSFPTDFIFLFCPVGSSREGSAGVATASASRFRQGASGTTAGTGRGCDGAAAIGVGAVAAAVAVAGAAVAATFAVAGAAVAAAASAVASSSESTSVDDSGVVILEHGDGGNGGVSGKGIASAAASDNNTANLKASWASRARLKASSMALPDHPLPPSVRETPCEPNGYELSK